MRFAAMYVIASLLSRLSQSYSFLFKSCQIVAQGVLEYFSAVSIYVSHVFTPSQILKSLGWFGVPSFQKSYFEAKLLYLSTLQIFVNETIPQCMKNTEKVSFYYQFIKRNRNFEAFHSKKIAGNRQNRKQDL